MPKIIDKSFMDAFESKAMILERCKTELNRDAFIIIVKKDGEQRLDLVTFPFNIPDKPLEKSTLWDKPIDGYYFDLGQDFLPALAQWCDDPDVPRQSIEDTLKDILDHQSKVNVGTPPVSTRYLDRETMFKEIDL